VRFLVDAQLPARLARFLAGAGHDAIHTRDLPDGNRTTDVQIARRADADGRIVVTKDRDFRDGHSRSSRRVLLRYPQELSVAGCEAPLRRGFRFVSPRRTSRPAS
jgi:predicted nuclease of predicted toxin-antitoxin system